MITTIDDNHVTETEALAIVLQLAHLRHAEIKNDDQRQKKYYPETLARYEQALSRVEALLDEMEDDLP